MPSTPKWLRDPDRQPPLIYRALADKWGPRILGGSVTVRDIMTAEGMAEFSATSLIWYVVGKHENKWAGPSAASGPAPPAAPPAEAKMSGPAKDLPRFQRWDKAPADSVPWGPFDPDEDEEPIEDLIERKRMEFRRLKSAKEKKKYQVTNVREPGPLGLVVFGDPHVDDPGCDVDALTHAVRICATTPNTWGILLGDEMNNWVGRLERLYMDQRTTYSEGVRIAKWHMHSCPYVLAMLGNHDHWNRGSVLYDHLMAGASIAHKVEHTGRLVLRWPDESEMRILIRHDFRGRSMWNKAHGGLRASKLDPHYDLYLSGHRHEVAEHAEVGHDGTRRVALLLASFERYDDYAEALGLPDSPHGAAAFVILDPKAHPMERVRWCWDLDYGADLLGWLKRRA